VHLYDLFRTNVSRVFSITLGLNYHQTHLWKYNPILCQKKTLVAVSPFWNLEKSCVENTLISNATRPTWDQSHGPQLPRGISETSQGKALKMAFWRSTNSISKPVSSSWLRGLPEGHTPPINWGKMIHPPGDVSTTGPN
jgi:hypothetical protein